MLGLAYFTLKNTSVKNCLRLDCNCFYKKRKKQNNLNVNITIVLFTDDKID